MPLCRLSPSLSSSPTPLLSFVRVCIRSAPTTHTRTHLRVRQLAVLGLKGLADVPNQVHAVLLHQQVQEVVGVGLEACVSVCASRGGVCRGMRAREFPVCAQGCATQLNAPASAPIFCSTARFFSLSTMGLVTRSASAWLLFMSWNTASISAWMGSSLPFSLARSTRALA